MSDGFCDVQIDADCDEQASVWVVKPRIAAKPHRCTDCRGPIAKGERHILINCLAGGMWDHMRICLPCEEIAREFMTTRVVGILWDEFDHQWEEGATVQGCMNRVQSPAAKQKLLEQWQRWKGLA